MPERNILFIRILIALEAGREQTVTWTLKEATPPRFELLSAHSLESVRSVLRSQAVDMIITGVDALGQQGVSVINHIRRITVDLPIVMVSQEPSVGIATDAIRRGAADFIHLAPDQMSELPAELERIRERWQHDRFAWDEIARMHWSFELRDAVRQAASVNEALNVVLRKVCETTGWKFGEVWWPDQEPRRLHWLQGYSQGDQDAQALKAEVSEFVIDRDGGLIVDAWSTRRPAWEEEVSQSETFVRRQTASALALSTAIAIPVLNKGTPYAVIAFFNDRFGSNDYRRIDLIAAAAMHLGEWLDRKKAEKELAQTRYLLEKTFDSLHEAVFVIDEETCTIMKCNRAVSGMFGYSPEELIGKGTDLLHESRESYEQFGIDSRNELNREGFFAAEYKMRRKDGTVFPTEHCICPLLDETERRIAAISVVRDLTKSKRLEASLQKSRAWLNYLFDSMAVGVCAVDADGYLERYNDAMAKLWGRSPPFGEARECYSGAMRLRELDGTPVSREHWPVAEVLRTDRPVRRELIIDRPDGSEVVAEVYTSPVRDEAGQSIGVVNCAIDVTARYRAERLQSLASRITEAEQRERRRVAQFLHDHLQQIIVAAKMQVGRLETTQHVSRARELLDEAISSARNLSHDLYPPVLYDRGLAEALQWLSRRYREDQLLEIEVNVDSAAEPPDHHLKAFLFQAVRELLLNALKHGRDNRVWITMTRDNEMLTITVRDNGVGCNPDQVLRPKGDSMGLFRIRERLSMLGGSMTVETAINQGFKISLRCPIDSPVGGGDLGASGIQADIGYKGGQMQDLPSEGGSTRVMVVDDHQMFRDSLAGILRTEEGITVVAEAADGREAVELVGETRPDVIIMDGSMPRMNGVEATKTIHREHPRIRIIGLSMYGDEFADAMYEAGASVYLTKNGPISDLIDAIRSG